jgi:hypothetical protein
MERTVSEQAPNSFQAEADSMIQPESFTIDLPEKVNKLYRTLLSERSVEVMPIQLTMRKVSRWCSVSCRAVFYPDS